MRRPIVAGNWKMHRGIDDGRALAAAVVRSTAPVVAGGAIDVVLCPPFVDLTAVGEEIAGSSLSLGAQNMNADREGAYTGEVSWSMLQGLCDYVIVGHSERRRYFGETDDDVRAKVAAALAAGLTPLACVGEHAEEHDHGDAVPFITHQVRALLADVRPDDAARLVIAYEPLWAIGTGQPATGEIARRIALLIRSIVADRFDDVTAAAVRVQYGGSVTGANAAEFASQPDIDGALIGGASLDAAAFAAIVRAFAT